MLGLCDFVGRKRTCLSYKPTRDMGFPGRRRPPIDAKSERLMKWGDEIMKYFTLLAVEKKTHKCRLSGWGLVYHADWCHLLFKREIETSWEITWGGDWKEFDWVLKITLSKFDEGVKFDYIYFFLINIWYKHLAVSTVQRNLIQQIHAHLCGSDPPLTSSRLRAN